MTTPKSLLLALAIAGGLILLIMMTYLVPIFLSNNPEAENAAPTPAPTQIDSMGTPPNDNAEGPIIVIRPFQRLVTSDGQPELEIRADEAVIDQAAREFHLKNINEILFFGNQKERVSITAGEGFWNQLTNSISVTGNIVAKIETPEKETITLTCQWMKYDHDQSLVTGGDDVEITQKYYSATGKKLTLRIKMNHIQLEDQVIATIDPEEIRSQSSLELHDPITISCGLMLYNGTAEVLQFDYSPVVQSGRSRITCGRISAFMQPGNRRIIWSDQCVFLLANPDGGDAPVEIRAQEVTMDLKAATILMDRDVSIIRNSSRISAGKQVVINLNPDTEKVLGGSAFGGVIISDPEYSGKAESIAWDATNSVVIMSENAQLGNNRDTLIEGDQIQLHLDRQYYAARGDVRLQFIGTPGTGSSQTPKAGLLQRFAFDSSGSGEPIHARMRSLEIDDRAGRILMEEGVEGYQGSSRFAADKTTIQFDILTRQLLNLEASGNVTLSDQDRLLTGGRLRYTALTGQAELLENPVMWHGDSQLRADRFSYNENEKLLNMTGHVEGIALTESTGLGEPPGKEISSGAVTAVPEGSGATTATPSTPGSSLSDRYLYLTAGNGTYNEVTGDLQFRDQVTMKQGLWTIRSDSVQIEQDPATGQMKTAHALGDVKVHHSMFDAEGHSLTYNPETSILVLRGSGTRKCLVTQGERGSQGDEVRFFIQENRLEIDKGISMIMPSEISGTLQ